jgi:negative regulator of sigma E activity
MVMNENISRLMDGELEDHEFESCCAQLKSKDATDAWLCYHVIGDHLRGTAAKAGGSAFMEKMHKALEAEPTVLAPQVRAPRKQPAAFAWAVAATLAAVTVVGYTAFSMVDVPPTGIARAREASTVRVAAPRVPAAEVPNEYLLAHQEYSPLALQGGAAYLRSASATVPAAAE